MHETVGNADLRSLHNNDLNQDKLKYDRTKMYLSKLIHGFNSSKQEWFSKGSVTELLVLSCVEISRSAEMQITSHFKNYAKTKQT